LRGHTGDDGSKFDTRNIIVEAMPNLKVSRSEAAAAIQKQIEAGQDLVAWPSAPDYDFPKANKLSEEAKIWTDTTARIIGNLFDDTEFSGKFLDAGRFRIPRPSRRAYEQPVDPTPHFSGSLRARITTLRSILAQLPHIKEPLFSTAVEEQPAQPTTSLPPSPQPDPRRVFVVHGRNLKARDAMFHLPSLNQPRPHRMERSHLVYRRRSTIHRPDTRNHLRPGQSGRRSDYW
jgi:hypothetical protein